MSITVETAATTTRLTTVETVTAREEVDAETDPATVGRLIDAATRAIERFCNRTFARQTYIERIDGNASRDLLLRNSPIIGTPTIVADSTPVIDFEVGDASAGILYREAGWLTSGDTYWFAEGDYLPTTNGMRYTVTYEAGYKLPGEDDSTLPYDIEQACIETVVYWLVRNPDVNVRSHKVDDLMITYAEGMSADHEGIPPIARSMLPRRLTA